MTEKQFEWDTIDGDVIFYEDGAVIDYDDVVDLLNENKQLKELMGLCNTDHPQKFYEVLTQYIEENEQLRKSNKFLSDMRNIIDIVDKNKQLTQFIKELTTKGTGRIDLASGYSYNVSAILADWKGDVE